MSNATVLQEKKAWKDKTTGERIKTFLYPALIVLALLLLWQGCNKIFPNKAKESPAKEKESPQTTVEKKTEDPSSLENEQNQTQVLDIDPADIIETPLGESIQNLAKDASKTTRTVTPNGDGTFTETIVVE